MTISGYSNAIVDIMLGWLKGIANWVLRLFNLAGSGGVSPLLWLSENWLKLLILFLIVGMVLDRLVWLIRWRPYWVWFRKERVIVNDDKFFSKMDMEDGALDANWEERDYVIASAASKRPSRVKPAKTTAHAGKNPPERRPSTQVKRRVSSNSAAHRQSSSVVPVHKRPSGEAKPENRKRYRYAAQPVSKMNSSMPRRQKPRRPEVSDSIEMDLFGIDTNQPDASDFYEDEVFNVSNLPILNEYSEEDGQK